MTATPQQIIDFWINVVGEERWYSKQAALDDVIRKNYRAVWDDARANRLADWEKTADGVLALLIVLDQFPRNMFRDHADAFATDAQARAVADRAIAHGFDMHISPPIRQFFYTPFEHSENIEDQNRSLALFEKGLGAEHYTHRYVLWHRNEIVRFGRFPGRNQALGRASTPEELEFLKRKT